MNKVYKDLIYLLQCAVNSTSPDAEKVAEMDMDKLYKLSEYHTVRSAVCFALEQAGVTDQRFDQAQKKAIRKNIYLDMERTAILDDFEKQGIWYLPLKGSVIKDMYPENGMREMSDNDILYNKQKQQESMEIMLAHGYSVESFGGGHHDVYHKPPVLVFELHTALFGKSEGKHFFDYYRNIKGLMLRDKGKKYGYHLSDEDQYIYITAHEYKHFSDGGTGIRSLMDCYVYCKALGKSLDWKYITQELDQLGIAGYERSRRKLAMKIFSQPELPQLTEKEEKLLMQFLLLGTYGTLQTSVSRRIAKQHRIPYILHNIFPPMDHMKHSVKFVDKCPLLYPAGVAVRCYRALTKRRGVLSVMLKMLRKKDNKAHQAAIRK